MRALPAASIGPRTRRACAAGALRRAILLCVPGQKALPPPPSAAAPGFCSTPPAAADVTAVCLPVCCQVAAEPTDRLRRGHHRPEYPVLRRLPLTLLPRVVVPKSKAQKVPVLLSTSCERTCGDGSA
eukprot:scaffold109197_cov65-Phaeocystis_antarctica.AAC.3